MMDWTDRRRRVFHRRLTRRARLYTEMISADAVAFGPRERLLAFDASEHPVALQLDDAEPKRLAEAARAAAEDSPPTIDKRLENARRDTERWRQHDHVVVNDALQRAYAEVTAIIPAERARCARLAEGVEAFVARLLGG